MEIIREKQKEMDGGVPAKVIKECARKQGVYSGFVPGFLQQASKRGDIRKIEEGGENRYKIPP